LLLKLVYYWYFGMPNTVELAIQKVFNVKIHLPNAPKIEDILWHSLLISWTKYNSNGAVHGCPGNVVYVVVC
jgi:hypothetical protein